MKKKITAIILGAAAALSAIGLSGCGDDEKNIFVVNRDKESGTRDGFESVIGFTDEELATFESVEGLVASSTDAVLTGVADNASGIGYASLASISANGSVKAVKYNGIEAKEANVQDGTYKLQRPFVLVTKTGSDLSAQAQDFYNYIVSTNAESVIVANGLVLTSDARTAYTTTNATVTGKVTLRGSTSMEKVMSKLIGEYKKLQPSVEFDMSCPGSGAGISGVSGGNCDIGMASRALKSSETGLTAKNLCLDGIAIVVNKSNEIENLTTEQVKSIWTGKTKKFSELK